MYGFMVRKSAIDGREDAAQINKDIIEAHLSIEEIAEKYGITASAIKWHKAHKLQPEIEALRKSRRETIQTGVKDSVSVLDAIIEKWPEVINEVSLRTIIEAIKTRAELTGESKSPPRIEIVWGKGLTERPQLEDSYDDSKDTDKDRGY